MMEVIDNECVRHFCKVSRIGNQYHIWCSTGCAIKLSSLTSYATAGMKRKQGHSHSPLSLTTKPFLILKFFSRFWNYNLLMEYCFFLVIEIILSMNCLLTLLSKLRDRRIQPYWQHRLQTQLTTPYNKTISDTDRALALNTGDQISTSMWFYLYCLCWNPWASP